MMLLIFIVVNFLCPLPFPTLHISFLPVIASTVDEFVVEEPDFVVWNLPTLTVY